MKPFDDIISILLQQIIGTGVTQSV